MLLLGHLGEGSEGEGALHLAHVVFEDCVGGEGLGQVEAVLDLEALTDWALLGAGAHCAGRHPPRRPDVNGLVADIAAHSLLPQVEIDLREGGARHPGVEEGVGDIKQSPLDVGDGVTVVAHRFGQRDLPDLIELGLGEPD